MAKEPKYVPLTITQEEWDNRPPWPAGSEVPFNDPNEPDDFEEIFLANLNENTREKTPEEQAEYEREKYPDVS